MSVWSTPTHIPRGLTNNKPGESIDWTGAVLNKDGYLQLKPPLTYITGLLAETEFCNTCSSLAKAKDTSLSGVGSARQAHTHQS
jgi:hypothetical protein